MNKLTKNDLSQINQETLDRLEKKQLVSLSLRLRNQLCEAIERLDLDSTNSSKPPSSDNPFVKKNKKDNPSEETKEEDTADESKAEEETQPDITEEKEDPPKRPPGRQFGSKGFGRSGEPDVDFIQEHHIKECIICGQKLEESAQPDTGFYTFELERGPFGCKIICILHHYYSKICQCGHENTAMPGEGYISIIEGRKRNLQLKEYTIVGPMLTTFIGALARRYRMSRKMIRDFLIQWYGFELSVGSICKCIREGGVACYPVVEELVKELQEQEIIHMDETPWYEKTKMLWLWVATSAQVVVYYIGTRKKVELLNLITESFAGWLVADGYRSYRDREKRQRCLAHLIRKAVALTGAVDGNVQKMGDWFLRELRGLIKAMAQGEAGKIECRPILARLKKACNLGSKSDHSKLKSLAKEILNDWNAVVAFVKNPELPATNNEAERALRHAVIYRRITFGTRTSEGSRSYASFISVVETCRLRDIDPWEYIAQVIACGRKGLEPPQLGKK